MLDQLSPLTMIQVDFIRMNDYPADSYAISPTAFLFLVVPDGNLQTEGSSSKPDLCEDPKSPEYILGYLDPV